MIIKSIINLLEWLTELWKQFTCYLPVFHKRLWWRIWMSTQKEETQRDAKWKGAELPLPSGASHPLTTSTCSPSWNLIKSHTLGSFMWASSRRHDQSWIHFQPLSPLRRKGGWAENSKLLISDWSFWWPTPSRSPPRLTSLEPKTLLSPRLF